MTQAAVATTGQRLLELNCDLRRTVRRLERRMDVHTRLTQVTIDGRGQQGIADALFELTGYPVAVEDRFGNLRAWAGPSRPDPYPKDPPMRREQLVRRLYWAHGALRDRGRLLAVVRARGEVLGVLGLIDPSARAGEHELVAVDFGCKVLAMELAYLRCVAESQARRHGDLVEALLNGTEEASVLAYADGLGYDLAQPHWFVAAEGTGATTDDELLHCVRRAVREMSAGELVVPRDGLVVVLADRALDWEELRRWVHRQLTGGGCRLGVGGRASGRAELVRSHREAMLAIRMLRLYSTQDRCLSFDGSGVYRLLSGLEDLAQVEAYVREWLGTLIDHDARRGGDLVRTLTEYLDRGGSWEAAAASLFVHRSTVKYRLQRIREITGLELNDPNIRFNLQLATRAWQTRQALSSSPPG
jgi:sugar diacid utilization regulator